MLKPSEDILNQLLDSSDSMISIIDDKMRYVTVNESFCRSFNMEKKDLVGKSPSELWGEDIYRNKIRANLEKSLGGETVEYRAFFDISGTTPNYYDVSYKPLRSPGTNLNYALIETRGPAITERESKRKSDRDTKYEYIERYLPFGIFSCERDGRVLEANDTFYRILEVDAEKGKIIDFNDFLKTDRRFATYLLAGQAGETATFGQMQIITPAGREAFVRISSHLRRDEQYGIVADGTLEDVTREVLMDRRLQQAQRLETVGTLTGGVAHDFNTILTTISGYSEMTMEEAGKDSLIYKYMSKQKSAVNKAVRIVNQLLAFSRQLDQHLVAIDPGSVVREAVAFMKSSVPGNIKIKTEYNEVDGLIYADPTQLFRVFLNIMTNAVHAMEEKGGLMTIIMSESVADGCRYANISIADTGEGIDQSIITRIFEPFFTTRQDKDGTGMGLAVSHGIITGIGGEINVESSPGKGSEFILRMPLQEVSTALESAEKSKQGKVVFAHDNPYLSRSLSLALQGMGYNVVLINSYDELENILLHHLHDCNMLFIVSKYADSKISGLIDDMHKEGKSFRVCIIHEKDSPEDRLTGEGYKQGYGSIKEPLTLRDVISQLY